MSEQDRQYDELFSRLGTQNARVKPSPEREAQIRKECTASLTPIAPLKRWQRVASCCALGLLVMSGLAALTRGDGVHQLTRSTLYGAAAWALVLLSVLLVGFGPQGSRAALFRIGAALSVPLAFLAYLGVSQSAWTPLVEWIGHPIHCANAFRCGVMALGLGAISASGVMLVWRRTDPFNPGWSGALAGVVGGMTGALSVGLVCPDGEAWHLWLGHGVGVVMLVLIGAWLGRRVLSP